MTSQHSWLRALFALSAAALACTLFSTGAAPPKPNQPAAALFQDDFSDPGSGWSVQQGQGFTLEYGSGEFRIFVDNQAQPNAYPSTYVVASFGDVRVEADVRRVSGIDASKAGLICRRTDAGDFVFGDIDSLGEARIGFFSEGVYDILGDEQGTVGLGAGTDRLRLDCVGTTATLYVNGTPVVSAEVDEAAAAGSVGLAAGRAADGQTDFRFSDFSVNPQ